eukprot:1365249-Pleurochrysis_carterae.AAC.1
MSSATQNLRKAVWAADEMIAVCMLPLLPRDTPPLETTRRSLNFHGRATNGSNRASAVDCASLRPSA